MIRLLALVLSVLGATAAAAHQAPSGWWYSTACCSSDDCAPIPSDAVRFLGGGRIVVTLEPGDHPLVTTRQVYEIDFSDRMHPSSATPKVQPSGDDQFHACLYPDETVLRCLYIVPGGV